MPLGIDVRISGFLPKTIKDADGHEYECLGIALSDPCWGPFARDKTAGYLTILAGALVSLAPPPEAELCRWEEEGGK